MAVDTLFLCFSDDYNTYDTTDGRDLVAEKELYEFMVKHEDIDRKNSRKKRQREPPETIRFKEGTVWAKMFPGNHQVWKGIIWEGLSWLTSLMLLSWFQYTSANLLSEKVSYYSSICNGILVKLIIDTLASNTSQ